MSRVLFVDAGQGASGDMILGALLDLGVPESAVRKVLESLPIEGWRLSSRRINRCALDGLKVDVTLERDEADRDWAALREVVSAGSMPEPARERALAVFRRLIEAEARVHGRAVEQVHLHEAGGTDAIIDVVGACVALEHLGIEEIVVSPLTTGYGEVRCAHGVYPVPAPATLLLVEGAPVRGGEIEAERLTPTGAALLTTLADGYGALPAMRPEAVGYGAGARDLSPIPNMLRMVVGRRDDDAAKPGGAGEIVVIECTLDDATPQTLAFAAERLLEAGALDVFTTPVVMKKGRQGQQLTVLARPERLDELAQRVLTDTPSLGLRFRRERRIELERESVGVDTPFGTIAVKVGRIDGRVVKAWPEHDDCAAAARSTGRPLQEIRQAALRAFHDETS